CCGASPPTIGTVERRRVAAGRGATCAPPVSTVECRRIAAGRRRTHAASIGPVEPGLLSGPSLVEGKADEGQAKNCKQYSAAPFPPHFHPPMGTDLVVLPCRQDLLLCAKHLLVAAKSSGERLTDGLAMFDSLRLRFTTLAYAGGDGADEQMFGGD